MNRYVIDGGFMLHASGNSDSAGAFCGHRWQKLWAPTTEERDKRSGKSSCRVTGVIGIVSTKATSWTHEHYQETSRATGAVVAGTQRSSRPGHR